MSRIWKEPYLSETARQLGIRELEAQTLLRWDGQSALWVSTRPEPQWIYYVHVCGFTFAFFSTQMIRDYLNYYSQKVLPSRIPDTPHSNQDLRQSVFMRLPLYLREEPKRLKVVKALERALEEFRD